MPELKLEVGELVDIRQEYRRNQKDLEACEKARIVRVYDGEWDEDSRSSTRIDVKCNINGMFKNLTTFQVYHPDKRDSEDTYLRNQLIAVRHTVERELTTRGRQRSVY
jgi:hypothetical protein